MTSTPANNWIEIFRAGTHTDMHGRGMEFTEAHLQEIADSYDPAKHEAPVVVGHPRHNHPAYGWVGALKYMAGSVLADGGIEAGKLLYQERESEPAFNEMREAGRFKKRSASFYLPDSPGNPTPGKLHIRHVGWLGAMPPAVKGLKDVEFADDGAGIVEFADDWNMRWGFRTLAGMVGRIRDRLIETDGVEVADRILPHYEIESLREAGLIDNNSATAVPGFGEGVEADVTDSRESDTPVHDARIPGAAAAASGAAVDTTDPTEDQAMTDKQKELDDREAALKTQEEKLVTDQAAFSEQQKVLDADKAKVARIEATEFADALVASGKLAPSARNAVVELQLASDASPPLNFSEAEGAAPAEKSARDTLRGVLSSMTKQFDFSEKSGEDDKGVNLNDPNAIARAAVSFQESQKKDGHEISIAQAVLHITKGDK